MRNILMIAAAGVLCAACAGGMQTTAEKVPADAAASRSGADMGQGRQTYDAHCKMCHASGMAGAPKVGDKEAWKPLIAQGVKTLVDRSIKGYKGSRGYMPAKGGNSSLSDQSVEAAVHYMVQESE